MDKQLELLIDEDAWTTGDQSQIWDTTTWSAEMDDKTSMFASTPPTTATTTTILSDTFDANACWSPESSDDEAPFFSATTGMPTESLLSDGDLEPCADSELTALATTTVSEPFTWTGDADVKKESADTKTGSRKRSAKDAGISADTGNTGEMCWKRIIKLLDDDSFQPGVRPDVITDKTVVADVMYKETPKRRRPHSSATHPRDKWYNTGGIKSASDRFDKQSGLGLRKRYGKVVRRGLPVLRFYEYKLLHRDSKTGEHDERKDGPTLMHLVPVLNRPKTSDRDIVSPLEERARNQEETIAKMRTKEADLRRELAKAQALIKQQAAALKKLRTSGRKRA